MLNFAAVVNLDAPSEAWGDAVEGLSVTLAVLVIVLCMTLLLSYSWYVRAAATAEVTRAHLSMGSMSSTVGRNSGGSEVNGLELITNPVHGLEAPTPRQSETQGPSPTPPSRRLTPAMIEAQRQSAHEYELSHTQRRVDVVRRKKKEFHTGRRAGSSGSF